MVFEEVHQARDAFSADFNELQPFIEWNQGFVEKPQFPGDNDAGIMP
jgi:hypothetical protein